MAKNTQDNAIPEFIQKLNGSTSIVFTDENGVEYVAKYPRSLVRDMQRKGVTVEKAREYLSDGTIDGVETFLKEFVLPAFNVEQKMTLEQLEDVFEDIEDPSEVIEVLMALYSLPVYALLGKKDPTKTRAKFRLV